MQSIQGSRMTKPTIAELDEHLRGLVEWKGFALRLPEVDETDINIIAKNKPGDVVGQKLVLYETWLKACPHASWNDVIQALEKVQENAIASNLRAKFPAVQATMSPKQPGVQKQVPNKQMDAVLIEEDVLDELEELHSTFVSLATDLQQEVAKEVERNEKILIDFKKHIQEEKAFNIEVQSVQTTDQFFDVIRPHYNFMDFYIIKSLARKLSCTSTEAKSKAQKYEKQTKTFMKETKIGALRQKLEPYFTASKSGAKISVSVGLENAWGTQSVWLVKLLVAQFFSLQNPDQLQWLQAANKCLLVVFSAPKQMKQSLIENSSEKLQLMELTGVISLQIENVYVLKEEEKYTFSFEDSLVQAKIQENTEAVQLLEQCIQETSSLATMLKDESDDTHQDHANLSKKLLPNGAGLSENRNDAGKPKKGRKVELVHIQTTSTSESKRLLHSSEVEFSWKKERVDGIQKQEVSEVMPASESDISLAFLPRMCGCGKCTSVGWKTDISHQSIHSSKIPMVLATEPKPSPAPFFNQKCDSQATLCIATSGIIDHFQLVVSDIWKQLHDSVNDQKADISTITCTLCSELGIQIPLFSDLDSVQNYCHLFRVSWYNFCPLDLLVTQVMAQLSPSLLADWNIYLTRYRDFCSAYYLKDFADVSFGEEKHNTFLLELEVDKCHCNFTLLDIEHINASLSIAIGYPSVCLRLLTLTVKQQSLIIYFYYCCADYLTVFKSLTMIQLKTISEIETYRILSLTDSHNQFKHHNIQDYAKASPMNTISSSAAEHETLFSQKEAEIKRLKEEMNELKHLQDADSFERKAELSRLNDFIDSLSKDIEELKQQLHFNNTKLSEKEDLNANLSEEIERLKHQLHFNNTKLSEKEDLNAILSEEIEKLKQQMHLKGTDLFEKNAELSRQKDLVASLSKKIEELKQLSHLDNIKLCEKGAQLDRQKEEIEELKRQSLLKDTDISRKKAELRRQEEEIKELKMQSHCRDVEFSEKEAELVKKMKRQEELFASLSDEKDQLIIESHAELLAKECEMTFSTKMLEDTNKNLSEELEESKRQSAELQDIIKKMGEMRGKPVKTTTGLHRPWGTAVCDNGDIVVAELHTVTIVNKKGKKVRSFDMNGTKEFACPYGVVISIDGHILVTDNHRLQKRTFDGVCVKSVGSDKKGSGQLQFNFPQGITVHPTTGQIFVADTYNNRIQVFNNDLTFSHTITLHGNKHVNNPRDVSIDNEGCLYIAEYSNHCITKLTTTGQYITRFGCKGSAPGQLYYPTSLTIDNNLVYVSEWGNNRVSIFDTKGTFLHCFGKRGSGEGEFNRPYGITTDTNGNLYVSDYYNNRIVLFE